MMGSLTVHTKNKFGALGIVYVGMFSALMMIGANITSFVPFMVIGGVPITLQTFFAVLAGAFLGSRLGAISMAVYAFIGLVGAPVFARFSGGIGEILSPTFGFILSFIFTARSEEHTSELQSRENLVCRLLLEKEKNNIC